MEVPRLEKIVINMGVGRATQQASLIEGAQRDLEIITGQKPIVTRAKQSIAGFKLREGQAIGAKVTLRGDRAWEFFDRLLSLAIPRIRDFRGLSPRSFDGKGNYTFGVTEQLIFPEIDYDKIDSRPGHGHHDRHHRTQQRGRAGAPRGVRLPVPTGDSISIMAKKALIEKQQRTPKFKVRGLHPLPAMWPAQGRLQQVRALPYLPARDGARRRDSRRDKGELVGRTMTMTDPIADMLDAYPQRQLRHVRHGEDAGLQAEGVPGLHPRA